MDKNSAVELPIPSQHQPPTSSELTRGDAQFNKGDYSSAITHYTADISANPKNTVAFVNRGLAHFHNGNYEHAIEDFTKALQLVTNRMALSVRVALRIDRIIAGNEASRLCQIYHFLTSHITRLDLGCDSPLSSDVIQVYHECANLYCLRGRAHFHADDYKSAFDDSSDAIRLDRTNAEAYVIRGNARFMFLTKHMYFWSPWYSSSWEEVIADFDKAIHLDCEFAEAYASRGNAHHQSFNYYSANEDYSKAIELDPELTHACHFLDNARKHCTWLNRATAEYKLTEYSWYPDCLRFFMFTSLDENAAEVLSGFKGNCLDLDGLTSLSEAAAENLRDFEGSILLNGLTNLSDDAAWSLSRHTGEGLELKGLTSLSSLAACYLQGYAGKLSLTLDELPESAAEYLSESTSVSSETDGW